MPTPFSSQDLGRIFGARALTRGRTLGLAGGVDVQLNADTIAGTVQDQAFTYTISITPALLGRRVVFDHRCTCRVAGCEHLAAAAFAALDRFPALRRPEQQTFLDTLTNPPAEKERQRIVFELAPGDDPHACFVTSLLIGERSGIATPTTPRAIAADDKAAPLARDVAYLLGEGTEPRTGVRASAVADVLDALVESGQARWHAGGQRLVKGATKLFASTSAATLPPRSGVIVADSGPWYIDATTGAVGRVRIQAPTPPPRLPSAAPAPPPPPRRRIEPRTVSEQVIVDRPMVPVLRLTRLPCPDEFGRMQTIDALLLEFDYDGAVIPFDDDRQFVRVDAPGRTIVRPARPPSRNRGAGGYPPGRAGADAHGHRSGGKRPAGLRVPRTRRGGGLAGLRRGTPPGAPGARMAQPDRHRVRPAAGRSGRTVRHAGQRCSPRFGARIIFAGFRHRARRRPPSPIANPHAAAGARWHGGGAGHRRGGRHQPRRRPHPQAPSRPHRAPASGHGRFGRSSGTLNGETMVLDGAAAPAVLDLEDLVTTRWQDGAMIIEQVARFRATSDIPQATVPAAFTASLRPYQQLGVNWLQHLRANSLGGLLADDMGLGKTAQTIAHIAIEEDAGRLDRPVLVVVPTSLVPNWTAELNRFAPNLRVAVLHGLARREKRRDLTGVHVVITTYTVLTRDIEDMAGLPWHMVVLDEAQAIKSPAAKATHAVCRLETRHRLCLSGTPIENNLGELWSQFAFLMPGLLGSRKSFNRRFRAPIEKDGDPVRRGQLATRIRPFILRRTKSAVATELPPKHTILRRITLAPDQRELYETIRATMHEKVLAGIAARGVAQSHVLVLQALLKLRQVCCDPRLAGLRASGASSKLDDLMEMVSEMVAEGRRILLFSQFTSMLDLMKPVLITAGVPFVELRGDTVDRAAPVRRFEAGEVPLFLISLKAGGRGLNLTSADTVIHYDPWWNPAVEDQASDRAHRIGQTKSVFVYKLIAADTVEERIVELQERKAALASLALSEDGMSLPAMDAEDIDYLFGMVPGRLAA